MEDIVRSPYISIDAIDDATASAEGEIGLLDRRHIDPEKVRFTRTNLKKAKEWSETSLLAIVYPTNDIKELEQCYDDFMLMAHSLRKKADSACVEYFGMECEELYWYCRNMLRDNKFVFFYGESAFTEGYRDYTDLNKYTRMEVRKASTIDKYSDQLVSIEYLVPCDSNNTSVIWMDNDTVVGCVSVKKWGEHNLIRALEVNPKYRRQKLGSQIFQYAISELHGNALAVTPSNKIAIKLYEKKGFKKYEGPTKDGKIYMFLDSSKNESSYNFRMPFYKRYLKVHTEGDLDLAYSTSRLLYNDGNRYNEKLISNCISDVINNHKEEMDDIEIYPDLPNDCPMFTPEEMIDFGVFSDIDTDNYFGIQPDNTILEDLTSVKEWFESYKRAFSGIDESTFANYSKTWMNTVRNLCRELKQFKEAGDTLRVKSRMQSILELGWNPYLDFNAVNRSTAYKRLNEIASIGSRLYRVVDITTMTPIAEASEDKIEENDKDLVPVFITLLAGDTPFSAGVQIATMSKYSHAAIGFDPKLDKLYSFGMQQLASIKNASGLTIENMKKYGKSVKATVFAFFVKPKDYVNMKAFVDKFADDPDKTRYSFLNLFAFAFKIPLDRGDAYICSQFVDKVLKMADIDINNKNSAFVAPADFAKAAKKYKGSIYKVYDGFATKFNPASFIKKINTLLKKATPIREMSSINIDDDIGFIRSTFENVNDLNTLRYLSANVHKTHNPMIKSIYEEFIDPILNVEAIREARTSPIAFDKNGDLILTNIWNIDVDKEYNASHKILMNCTSSNLDSIKYEIAKLWMLNLLVEKKIEKGNNSDADLKKFSDQRARILNDFNKYLKIVMKNDPDFVFGEYFEQSPFNAGAIKITGTTVKYGAELLKSVILGRKFL